MLSPSRHFPQALYPVIQCDICTLMLCECASVCVRVSVSNACVLAFGLVLSFFFLDRSSSFGVCHGIDNKPLCSPARERPRAFISTLLSVSVLLWTVSHLLLLYLVLNLKAPSFQIRTDSFAGGCVALYVQHPNGNLWRVRAFSVWQFTNLKG